MILTWAFICIYCLHSDISKIILASTTLYRRTQKTHINSTLLTFVQVGQRSNRDGALLSLLSQIFQEPAFDILRTKEQLGELLLINSTFLLQLVDGWDMEPASRISWRRGSKLLKFRFWEIDFVAEKVCLDLSVIKNYGCGCSMREMKGSKIWIEIFKSLFLNSDLREVPKRSVLMFSVLFATIY